MNEAPVRFSVVVIAYNSGQALLDCVQRLSVDSDLLPYLRIVDNASQDGSVDRLRKQFPAVSVITASKNLGFAGGANLGLDASDTDVVILVNPDVEIGREALARLAAALMSNPKAAIAGCKLLYPDRKTVQHAGGSLSYPLALAEHYGYGQEDRGQYDGEREVEYVTGAVLGIRKSVLSEIGCFDEGFYPAYFEESDLCFRARRAGYKVVYVPQTVGIHQEHLTTGKNTLAYYRYYHRNRLRFVLKHYSDEQLWNDLRPAELDRQRQVETNEELLALLNAYEDNLATLEGHPDFLPNPGGAASLGSGLRRLELVRLLVSGVKRILAFGKGEAQMLEGQIGELAARRELIEPSFSSHAPVIGALIVRFRELWNGVSTKWYVRPIVQQQNEFNALVVGSLQTMSAAINDLRADVDGLQSNLQELGLTARSLEESVVDGERTAVRLNRDFAHLQNQLRRLEVRLEELQRTMMDESATRRGVEHD